MTGHAFIVGGVDDVQLRPPAISGWETDDDAPPSLGYERSVCNVCGSPWGPTRCSADGCASDEFTTTYVQPVPLRTRVMGLLKKPKPAPPRATAEQLGTLRALLELTELELEAIHAAVGGLAVAVRDGVEELGFVQGLVHRTVSIDGDAPLSQCDGLSLSLRAFRGGLTMAIQGLEDNPK
jgi:hypothetical protein